MSARKNWEAITTGPLTTRLLARWGRVGADELEVEVKRGLVAVNALRDLVVVDVAPNVPTTGPAEPADLALVAWWHDAPDNDPLPRLPTPGPAPPSRLPRRSVSRLSGRADQGGRPMTDTPNAEDVRSVLKHGHTEGDTDYRHYHPDGDTPHHHRGPGAVPRWDGQRCWRHYATVDVCGVFARPRTQRRGCGP